MTTTSSRPLSSIKVKPTLTFTLSPIPRELTAATTRRNANATTTVGTEMNSAR
jgi:hypothetical protein